MGWNGSGGGSTPDKPKVTAKKPSPVRGLVAGGLVIVLAAVAYFAFFSGDEKPQKEATTKERSRIKTVTPAAAPTNAVAKEEGPKVEIRKLGNGKIMKYVDGKEAWMFPREDYHGPVITTKVAYVKSLEEETFKHTADQQIASLLMARPGAQMINVLDYRRTFEKDFLASYENPFMIEPGDTERQKELKKAVAEVKGDLKARYEAGEDIAQIMIDTRKQLRELAAYKWEIQQEVDRYKNQEDVSEEDVNDFIAAANKMLEDRGIEPIRVKGFLKHKLLQSRANGGAAEQPQE